MLLKELSKMIDSKFDEEFEIKPLSEMTTFVITALYAKSINGYIVTASVDGNTVIIVSSKREERRVFKTLDALKRALHDVGITKFEVIG